MIETIAPPSTTRHLDSLRESTSRRVGVFAADEGGLFKIFQHLRLKTSLSESYDLKVVIEYRVASVLAGIHEMRQFAMNEDQVDVVRLVRIEDELKTAVSVLPCNDELSLRVLLQKLTRFDDQIFDCRDKTSKIVPLRVSDVIKPSEIANENSEVPLAA